MIAIAVADRSLYAWLRDRLLLSGGEGASVARGHGFTLVLADIADPRAFLDEVTELSGAETIMFAAVGASPSSDHETGDVILPNALLASEPVDGQELPPIWLDLYPDQDDLLYEDAFGLSIGGIALDAGVRETLDDAAMMELRARYEPDVVVPGIHAVAATHRVGGYESVFVPVIAVERPGSASGVDPVDSLARTIGFLRDSFA